jgi:hypothetical protein
LPKNHQPAIEEKSMNNRKFANLIATQVQTTGGYLYSGTKVTGTISGLTQEVWSTRPGEWYKPTRADVEANRKALANAPIGAMVGFFSSGEGCQTKEEWTKTGPCAWTKTLDIEDRWGDWGDAHEDRLHPEYSWVDYREEAVDWA